MGQQIISISDISNRLGFFVKRRIYNPKIVCVHVNNTIWAVRVGYVFHSYIDLDDVSLSKFGNSITDCFTINISEVRSVFNQLFLPRFV